MCNWLFSFVYFSELKKGISLANAEGNDRGIEGERK